MHDTLSEVSRSEDMLNAATQNSTPLTLNLPANAGHLAKPRCTHCAAAADGRRGDSKALVCRRAEGVSLELEDEARGAAARGGHAEARRPTLLLRAVLGRAVRDCGQSTRADACRGLERRRCT